MATQAEKDAVILEAAELLWPCEAKADEMCAEIDELITKGQAGYSVLDLSFSQKTRLNRRMRRAKAAAARLCDCLVDLHEESTAVVGEAGNPIPLSGGGNKTYP